MISSPTNSGSEVKKMASLLDFKYQKSMGELSKRFTFLNQQTRNRIEEKDEIKEEVWKEEEEE